MHFSDHRATARLAWTREVLDDRDLVLTAAHSDASFRSYWRTMHEGASWIVMDSPPAQEDPQPWLTLNRRLADAGLHVPAVRAHDLAQGFLLIEDLGSRHYLDALDADSADALYGDAMRALARMQAKVAHADLPPFDRALAATGLAVMPEWFLRRHLGHTPTTAERAVIDAASEVVIAAVLEQPRCFVHRDFHSRNLMVCDAPSATADPPRPVPSTLATPGIVDFQGALSGPPTYDLASLLRDAYVNWPRTRVEGWVHDYHRLAIDAGVIDAAVDQATFLRWFDLTGLHRHLRVLGQFYRLWYRDGKPGYLADVPRVYGYVLAVTRGYPELQGLADLLERHVEGRDLARVADGVLS